MWRSGRDLNIYEDSGCLWPSAPLCFPRTHTLNFGHFPSEPPRFLSWFPRPLLRQARELVAQMKQDPQVTWSQETLAAFIFILLFFMDTSLQTSTFIIVLKPRGGRGGRGGVWCEAESEETSPPASLLCCCCVAASSSAQSCVMLRNVSVHFVCVCVDQLSVTPASWLKFGGDANRFDRIVIFLRVILCVKKIRYFALCCYFCSVT